MTTGIETSRLAIAAMVSPALFYAGAGAASIPILIHLLNKRRFRRVGWAATDFLLEAQRQNRRRMRIEELILLALRCLAMCLIGLLLARWFLRPEALAAVLGTQARTDRIILLDDSYSMALQVRPGRAAEEGGGTRLTAGGFGGAADRAAQNTVFARATSAIHRLVKWIHDESPGDSITILLTSRPEQPLRNEPTAGTVDLSALQGQLDSLKPSCRAGNMAAALLAVRHILDGRDSAVNSAVYVVSDFQHSDWLGGAGPAGEAAPASDSDRQEASRRSAAAALAGWAGDQRDLRLFLADVGSDATDNLCITAIEAEQSQVVRGVGARYTARVANFGRTESKPTAMRVYVGDAAQPAVAVRAIAPRQTIEVPVEVTFPDEGSETLGLELEPDALPLDDARATANPVLRALRVLIVNGEPSTDSYRDEVFLLSVALRPEGPQFSGNELTVVEEAEFEATDLSNFHVVVLANVYRIDEDIATRLQEYVSGGGGVILFLGDQVDPDLYNRMLYREGKGLLPARLVEVLASPADQPGVRFGRADVTHPAMRRFSHADVPLFAEVTAWQFVACEMPSATRPSEGDVPAASQPAEGGATDASEPGPARVLLGFEDADQHAAILERSFGLGKVMLITTSADKEWGNLPDHPAFVVLAMELVQHVARRPRGQSECLVGQPIGFALDTGRFRPAALLKTPEYPQESAIRIEAQPDPQTAAPAIHWSRTDRPGVYRFDLDEVTGGGAREDVAVNLDTRESDLLRADRAALLAALGGLPVEYVPADKLVGTRDVEARQELWPAMLIALLGILMIEQTLAWWFGSERRLSALWRGGAG